MLEKQVFAQAWALLTTPTEQVVLTSEQAAAVVNAVNRQAPAPERPQTVAADSEAVVRRAALDALEDVARLLSSARRLSNDEIAEGLDRIARQIAWLEVGAAPKVERGERRMDGADTVGDRQEESQGVDRPA